MSTTQHHPSVLVEGFDPEAATVLADAALHLNEEHDDTVRLLALATEVGRACTTARIADVGPTGFGLAIVDRAGAEQRIHIPSPMVRDAVEQVQADLYAAIASARHAVGDAEPMTSLEEEMAGMGDLRTFVTTVTAITDVSPGMRQLTVRGGLEGFRPLAADQFVYVITDAPGGGGIPVGFQMADLQAAAPDAQPAAAYYTIRRSRPEVGELDLWVVLHDDHDDGTVSAWASTAQVGAQVALWGPRAAFDPPAGTTQLLLVGDETALPAMAGIIERRDPRVAVRALIEVPDADHVIDLDADAAVVVTWLARDGAPAGTGARLLDALVDLELDPEGLYAFGGGESRQMAGVRRHLREDRALPGRQIRISGYWRRSA